MTGGEAEGGGFRSIVFDCDSTLVTIEGIDELAGPRLAEITAMTDAAMAGAIPLAEVYGRRLELIRPTRDQVDELGRSYVAALVTDARETIEALLWLGKQVRILSGGLRPPIVYLARELGLGADHVAAVDVRFADDGTYRGYDTSSPLARNGGKAEQIQAWDLPRPVLLVGDGATDAEARPVVDAFAAFMGVVHRPAVASAADIVIDQPTLAPVVTIAASPGEKVQLRRSRWATLIAPAER